MKPESSTAETPSPLRLAELTPAPPAPVTAPLRAKRPTVRGKYLFIGDEKFYARGVTYGPFGPDEHGCAYSDRPHVDDDFAAMAANGINAVRTYTLPPIWLLDAAEKRGLRVMVGVGLMGEQLSAFLDNRQTVRDVRRRCADHVRACAGHPALLAYAIGNEIPSSMARWHGRRRVEHFLRGMYDICKEHDAQGLVTYVNYPTTEYLQLRFLDFVSFNVYLESQTRFEAYLARLQNIADHRPLVMAEIGADSLRHGEEAQAQMLDWQLRRAYAGGCAGAFVFSWTDEWHTGGQNVHDWRFGVTDVRRQPKPALAAVRNAFREVPFPVTAALPKITVAVCTYNGSRTIRDCLEGCSRIDYPNYETIVVNDGSTDSTPDLVREFEVRLISTENMGLSHARNVALRAASGEIIAYLDDDARPDPHWLHHLAETFATTRHVGVGGPNIVPPQDPLVAQCVANSPGNPTHVLVDDRLAEHIPGCNMAFRVADLRTIGGFDRQFRIAGDDVDVCWQLQAQGGTLGFNPGAIVWHHRRNSVRAYWKQQFNYGRSEALLEVKWPEKFNAIGHIGWKGRLYGTACGRGIGLWPSRIYHGVWSTNAYQPMCMYDSPAASLPLTPEWYLFTIGLTLLSGVGLLWPPLLLAVPLLIVSLAATLTQALRSAARASFADDRPPSRWFRIKRYALTTALHLMQPAARLSGRLSCGLTPWRRQMPSVLAHPLPRTTLIWSETWKPHDQRLRDVEAILQGQGVPVQRGGDYDSWDLQVRGGLFASARTRMGVEEYPGGRQYVRFRTWPSFCGPSMSATLAFAALATAAIIGHAPVTAAVLIATAGMMLLRALGDCTAAINCLTVAFSRYGDQVQGTAAAADPSNNSLSKASVLPRSPNGKRESNEVALDGLDPLLDVRTGEV